jgi:molecular chaperone DnaK (HSP70)
MNLLNGDATTGTALRFSIFGSTLKVGAMVEPLTSQMAEYLGVSSGLMVKQVAHKTEAATAGLKAFDVILKVGTENIATIADWERALHANQGKPVQVTILRDKKQQTLTLQVDSKHIKGDLEMEDLFGSDECPLVAALGEQPAQVFAFDSQQAEEMRKQAEQLRDSMKDFQLDQKQLDEFKNQMNDWQKNFNTDQFRIDQKQLDEFKNQMDQWKQDIKPEMLELDPQWI